MWSWSLNEMYKWFPLNEAEISLNSKILKNIRNTNATHYALVSIFGQYFSCGSIFILQGKVRKEESKNEKYMKNILKFNLILNFGSCACFEKLNRLEKQ